MSAARHPCRPAGSLELAGDLVVVHWQRCTLVLSGAEIAGLLHHDRAVWARALKRGRSWRRAEALERRENKDKARAPAAAAATKPEDLRLPALGGPSAGVVRAEDAAPPVRLCGAPSPHEPREARGGAADFREG